MHSNGHKEPASASFLPVTAFPDPAVRDYGAGPDRNGTDVPRRDGISKEDLDTAVGAGARIADAVIIERVGGDFVPAVLFEGRDAWKVVRLRRYEGSRAWRSLDAAHAFLRTSGYAGDWTLLREDSATLAEMAGITDL